MLTYLVVKVSLGRADITAVLCVHAVAQAKVILSATELHFDAKHQSQLDPEKASVN